jgi:hypothetical protein
MKNESIKALATLRIEMTPYPHLRDSEGCVLARDFVYLEKVDFIIRTIRQAAKSGD